MCSITLHTHVRIIRHYAVRDVMTRHYAERGAAVIRHNAENENNGMRPGKCLKSIT